jgi:hypothetical protein
MFPALQMRLWHTMRSRTQTTEHWEHANGVLQYLWMTTMLSTG